jgi:hypothetical protein
MDIARTATVRSQKIGRNQAAVIVIFTAAIYSRLLARVASAKSDSERVRLAYATLSCVRHYLSYRGRTARLEFLQCCTRRASETPTGM